MMRTCSYTLCLFSLFLLLPGCSSSGNIIKPVSGPLPMLGNYVGEFDDGRLQVAPPVGWRSLGKTRAVEARFAADFDSLPRVWIQAESLEEYGVKGITDLSEQNVRDFAQQLAAEFDRRGLNLLERVRPMSVGNRFFVRYVISTKFSSKDRYGAVSVKNTERQILMTVASGRVYTVDLHVPVDTIPTYRNIGYSILAGLKFQAPPAKSASQANTGKTGPSPVPDDGKSS